MDFGLELLFLLLPVAALVGWVSGRRSEPRRRDDCPSLPAGYFKGLNYLLAEQPDKALEVFIQISELDNETVDIHFALGSLFRRRGEVDRAIRIHQNLIARPTLSRGQRNQALYELADDYMRAGLLDRAENLMQELVDEEEYAVAALKQLLDIYQQEKDWDKAVHVARRLAHSTGENHAALIAQFYCEQAEAALAQSRPDLVQRLIKRALAESRSCVRASLLEGRLQLNSNHPKAAVKALKRVEQQDPQLVLEALPLLKEAYTALDRPLEMISYLREVLQRHGGVSIMLALAALLHQHRGAAEASLFLAEQVRKAPSLRLLREWLQLRLEHGLAPQRDDLQLMVDSSEQLLGESLSYRCGHCGFTLKHMHWQCPSCRQWDTVRPLNGASVD